jgi:diguanylate cyclase (GGDEF)-like protein
MAVKMNIGKVLLMNIIGKFKSWLQKLHDNFLPSPLRKVEFVAYILSYLLVTWVVYSEFLPFRYKGVVSVVQSFISFYLAFRFRYLGLVIALIFNLNEIRQIAGLYAQGNHPELFIAPFVKLFTIITITFIAIVCTKQEEQRKLLRQLSITDELTGIYNQRFFHETLAKEIERADKNSGTVGLIVMDIDGFKMFNDIYGHDFGDVVLKGTGALLKTIAAAENRFVFRCGGDEFAIILSNTDSRTIEQIAYHLKNSVKEQGNNFYPDNLHNKITLSMGLSEYPHLSSSKDDLISQADMALYHAKNLGKDKIHFYQDVLSYIRKGISSDHQQLIGIFKALLSTISVKDKYTLAHCERVSSYVVIIGELLNLSEREITILQYAGLLHDIGKIELPKSVLNKREPLTEEEYAQIRMHPVYSENIVEPLENMDQLRDFIRHHHERYDGQGYPDGLSGDEISLGARILCIADSFDAMMSERPYCPSMSQEQAVQELQRCSGTQFDPRIVKIFVKAVQLKKLKYHKMLA